MVIDADDTAVITIPERRHRSTMARMLPETASGWVAWLSPGVMILVGAVLFFIPAPPTSLIGIALILIGGVLWLVDYFGGDRREWSARRRRRAHEEDVEAEQTHG